MNLPFALKSVFIFASLVFITSLMAGCGTEYDGYMYASNPNVAEYSGFINPLGIAVDGNGNIWATNSGAYGSLNGTTVTELVKSTGYSSRSFGGMNGPVGVAIDKSGNVWITNVVGNSVIELIAPGFSSSNTFSGTYFDGPEGIAADGSGNIWITNSAPTPSGPAGTTVTEILAGSNSCTSSACIVFSGTSYFQAPQGIAADNSGNIWVANAGGTINGVSYAGGITEITNGAASCTNVTCLVFSNPPSLAGAVGIAVDGSGNVWASLGINYATNPATSGISVAEIVAGAGSCTPASCLIFSDPFYFNGPFGIAADGAGNVWVASGTPTDSGPIQMITEIKAGAKSCAPSTCTLFAGPSYLLNDPNLIAIDGSGNVWITNPGYPGSVGSITGTTVIELKGMASPVATPIL
jgi:hypothetical protein